MIINVNRYSMYVLDAIKCIKQHVDADPFHYKTAAELLNHLSAPNRNAVEKAFRDLYGAGVKEYQVRQRLLASTNFLEQGMTKKQVARKCLYKTQSAFAAAFRKQFKMTPTEWQTNYKSMVWNNESNFDNNLASFDNNRA